MFHRSLPQSVIWLIFSNNYELMDFKSQIFSSQEFDIHLLVYLFAILSTTFLRKTLSIQPNEYRAEGNRDEPDDVTCSGRYIAHGRCVVTSGNGDAGAPLPAWAMGQQRVPKRWWSREPAR